MGAGVNSKNSSSSRRFWIVFGIVFAVIFIGSMFIFGIFAALLFGGAGLDSSSSGNVAVISLEGAIVGSSGSSGLLDSGSLGSLDYVALIERANEDESIEAIVIEINSPGGSAVASDEIAQAVLDSSKPTVALIREVGASGGYWVASASDYIVANRMSITGSIGVISSYLEFTGLMEEYGVSYERLVAGEKKDIGTPFRELGVSEKELLQVKLDLIHDYFIDAVAENRGLSQEEVVSLATGEFYLGSEALELGLVDSLGGYTFVEEYLLGLDLEIEEVKFVSFTPSLTALEQLFGVIERRSFQLGLGLGSGLDMDLIDGGAVQITV